MWMLIRSSKRPKKKSTAPVENMDLLSAIILVPITAVWGMLKEYSVQLIPAILVFVVGLYIAHRYGVVIEKGAVIEALKKHFELFFALGGLVILLLRLIFSLIRPKRK